MQKHAAGIKRLGPGIGRRQQIFECRQFIVSVVVRRDSAIAEALRLLFAEEINNAIPRDPKQPAGDMFDRHQQAVCLHQFVEDVLQNVLGVERISHAPPNKIAQPGLLPFDHFGDSLVRFECHPLQACRVLHLRL